MFTSALNTEKVKILEFLFTKIITEFYSISNFMLPMELNFKHRREKYIRSDLLTKEE